MILVWKSRFKASFGGPLERMSSGKGKRANQSFFLVFIRIPDFQKPILTIRIGGFALFKDAFAESILWGGLRVSSELRRKVLDCGWQLTILPARCLFIFECSVGKKFSQQGGESSKHFSKVDK